MHRITLVHWNEDEARERARLISELGFVVSSSIFDSNHFRDIRSDLPDAVVIDLTRLPSHGREVGVWIRETKATRHLPLVFVEGQPEKIKRVKQDLPQATFATYKNLKTKLLAEIRNPKTDRPKASSDPSGYSGTPLPKKLGIKAGMILHAIDAPDNLSAILGELPEEVQIRKQLRGQVELGLWFVKRRSSLENRIDTISAKLQPGAGLWIAWPKKSSGVVTDVTQTDVREIGLASGLVDYKICAIDSVWSGQKFALKK